MKKSWNVAAVVVGLFVLGSILASGSKHKDASTTANSPAVPASSSGTSGTANHDTKKTGPNQDAVKYIADHRLDIGKVAANVQDAEITLGEAAKSATAANIEQLAEIAQQAHDNIDGIRDDFAADSTDDTSSPLGQAELNLFSGANDLKNAMGQLVAVAGAPNDAATIAQFNVKFGQAQQEWNTGVRAIWKLARDKDDKPTV